MGSGKWRPSAAVMLPFKTKALTERPGGEQGELCLAEGTAWWKWKKVRLWHK